jgi:hypothetical protein
MPGDLHVYGLCKGAPARTLSTVDLCGGPLAARWQAYNWNCIVCIGRWQRLRLVFRLRFVPQRCTSVLVNTQGKSKGFGVQSNERTRNKQRSTCTGVIEYAPVSENSIYKPMYISKINLIINTKFYMNTFEEDIPSDNSDAFSTRVEESQVSQLSANVNAQNLEAICPDPSPITLEKYTQQDLDDLFVVKLQDSTGVFVERGLCMTKAELLQSLQYDRPKIANLQQWTLHPPTKFMSIAIPPADHNATGNLYSPTAKIVVNLTLNGVSIFVTLGSLKRIVTEQNKVWYAVKLFGGKRRRIGNLAGQSLNIGSNHAQIPGFYVYKLFTHDEISRGVVVREELSDYFLDDTSLAFYTQFDGQYLLSLFDKYFKIPNIDQVSIDSENDGSDSGMDIDYEDGTDDSETTEEEQDETEFAVSENTIDNPRVGRRYIRNNETPVLGTDALFSKFRSQILAIKRSQNILYVLDSSDNVKIWDMDTLEQINKLRTYCASCVHGEMFYYACGGTVKARNIRDRSEPNPSDPIVLNVPRMHILGIDVCTWQGVTYAITLIFKEAHSNAPSGVSIYNLQTQTLVKRLRVTDYSGQHTLYNDGRLYVHSDNHILKVYDVATGVLIRNIILTGVDYKRLKRMMVHDSFLYILYKDHHNLYKVSVDTLDVVDTIPVPHQNYKVLTFAVDANNVYFAVLLELGHLETYYVVHQPLNATDDELVDVQGWLPINGDVRDMSVHNGYLFYGMGKYLMVRKIRDAT